MHRDRNLLFRVLVVQLKQVTPSQLVEAAAACAICLALVWCAEAHAAPLVLVETEGFAETGGWVIDQQFMDEMGSPFLLAHGLGTPVADAVTDVKFPETGEYRVWVRTRDWVAPWKAPNTPPAKRATGMPGRFQVVVNGTPLDTVFGTEGAEWHWQSGGTATIGMETASVALRDLTGFEGRCDAILFSRDLEWTPPNTLKELTPLRRELLGLPDEPVLAGEYDLVVVGGGIAGTCAALSAARNGIRVALIQDRPVLGGNNSSEVRVWLGGERNLEPWPRVGDIVRELEQKNKAHYGPTNTADLYEDDRKLALVRSEKDIDLYLCHRANEVQMEGERIAAVVAQDIRTGKRRLFKGRNFADCTGDGCIGFLAGADHDITQEGHMGRCNLWNIKDTGKPVAFPRCPWALDLSDKPFPGRDEGDIERLGGWYWESGFDHDPVASGEYIRDWNFRAAYGAVDALKNVLGKYPNHTLNWMAYVSGKRESRRLLGDIVLTKEDVTCGHVYEDGCVPTGWDIDLHLPDPRYESGFEGDAFISKAHYTRYQKPYWVPYRCLYSRNVPNLFMAGRDASVTHEALGTIRVMRTGGLMGEIVGMAAALCARCNTDPRGIYTDHLEDLKALMKNGAGRK